MAKVFVFVEEQSSAVIVEALAKSMGIEPQVKILHHQGAGELQRSMATKITALAKGGRNFIILRDQDSHDCIRLKVDLEDNVPRQHKNVTKIRIACRELESWYLAQPEALRAARVLKHDIPRSIIKRNPDSIERPKEEIQRRTHKSGQIWLARLVGPKLDVNDQRSSSFACFVKCLRESVSG